MKDSRDSFESSLNELISNTNSKTFSRLLPMDYEENDNSEEKTLQNNRNSLILTLANPRNNNNLKEIIKSSEFTPEQISNHYGDCIKLASENKITPKNAFDLHLIDYLQDHMHNLKSFQKVSSSLDAGAKIYAGRVDMVHANTYHILAGCSSLPIDQKKSHNILEKREGLEDYNLELKMRKQKKSIDSHKKMCCTNIRKIRLSPTQIRNEVDPLFQSQAKMYDEGGTGELRLNNLKFMDDTYGLLLDFNTIVSTKNEYYDDADISAKVFDITEFSQMLKELSHKVVSITPEFEEFKFTGWDPSTETMNSQAAKSFKSLMYKNMDDDNEDNVEDNHMDCEIVEEEKEDEEEVDENILKIGSSKYESGSSFFLSSVKEMVNKYMDNYGEINDNILGMWAGPSHWKEKSKPMKAIHKNIIKHKKTKQENDPSSMFPEWVDTMKNMYQVGRLVDIKYEDVNYKVSKVSNEITDIFLNKNIKKEYILPPRIQFSFKSINQLMNRDISLVNKALKKHSERLSCVDLTEDQLPGIENNSKNCNLEMLSDDMIVIDDEGNIKNHINKNENEDTYFSDDDPYTGNSIGNNIFDDFGIQLAGDNAGTEALDINYSKTAKKINIKKLKQQILTYLNKKINIQEMDFIKEKSYPTIHMSKDFCNLSDLLINVDTFMSLDVSKDLSISILMNCLLHLANEIGLDMINKEDFSDFCLGQGFSEYDLEQVVLYGVGKEHYTENRKRKSTTIDSDYKKDRSKRKSNLLIFDIDKESG